MIELKKHPGQRMLELGGGDNRHPESDVNVDARPGPKVDFTADFNQPLPIADDDFDAVYSHFALEHISFRNILQFLQEVKRVLKPGAKCIFAIPNTEAQMKWIADHKEGWDGKDAFTAASEVIFGSQDYPENSHRVYFSPMIAQKLFSDAGFVNVITVPYGERDTDMVVTAAKPMNAQPIPLTPIQIALAETAATAQQTIEKIDEQNKVANEALEKIKAIPRETLFDKRYFNGGGFVGGYAREGFWDYPVHEITAHHILARKPESVLEIGAARGYILKRIQDKGIFGMGLEISSHCYLTRVCNELWPFDICKTPWVDIKDKGFDLCYSVATMEHIPEEFLPAIIREMARVSKRGLHGIDFGENDDGFDKTHCTLRTKSWWEEAFRVNAPGYPIEIVDKELLEKGITPDSVLQGDGKIKLNIGSFTTMHQHGWLNIDIHNLFDHAQTRGYKFFQRDVRQGLPYDTGFVDMIMTNHFLEHLTYEEGQSFLRECRRVLKPDTGVMRIVVPDAELLMKYYAREKINSEAGHEKEQGYNIDRFDEISDGAAKRSTAAGKLWELLHMGHSACYDWEALKLMLEEAGFEAELSSFRTESKFTDSRQSALHQILTETLDMMPELSLFVNAIPKVV